MIDLDLLYKGGIGLVCVLALIVIFLKVAAALGLGKITPKNIHLKDTLVLDPKRRLVLIEQGSHQHLLFLAPQRDFLIMSCDIKEKISLDSLPTLKENHDSQ